MKAIFLSCIGLATAASVAASAIVDDAANRYEPRLPFKIVFVSQLSSKLERDRVLSMATKSRVAAIRQELQADPVLSSKLRARGIAIRKIVGRQTATNGRIIFFVR